MNPRQRILATLAHQTPDRIPTDGWFHHEVQDMLKAHFQTDDWAEVLLALGIEGWVTLGPALMPPAADRAVEFQLGHASGQPAVWKDDRTFEDAWGVRFRLGEDGRYREWIDGPLLHADTVEAVERFALLKTMGIHEPDDYAATVARLKTEDKFVCANIENPFRRLWNLRGYQNALMDYVANVEVLETIYDALYELYTDQAVRAARAGTDMIKLVGDIAMQDRVIMGPELWRRHDKPRFARLIETVRAEKPDMFFFFHSDGNLTDLMDDFIDVGLDVINPIQPECMDPVEAKHRWGDRVTLHGCISIQQTLPFGSIDDVRHEVENLVRQCGRDGGLVLMPSNNIQPDTPVENILACYHTIRDLDVRTLG